MTMRYRVTQGKWWKTADRTKLPAAGARAAARDRRCNTRRAGSAFSLLEVMVALAILFMAVFTILDVVSGALRNARALQITPADPGMLAAQLSLTNRLFEGSDSGDFGELFPGYTWTREVYEVASNRLFQVDFTVHHRVGKNDVESQLSIYLYRPESQAGRIGLGFGR